MGAPYLARIMQLQNEAKTAAVKGNFAESKRLAAEVLKLQQPQRKKKKK